ncbi:hypothetical protein GCM10009540_17900 [Streptomyces turgidiscabies]
MHDRAGQLRIVRVDHDGVPVLPDQDDPAARAEDTPCFRHRAPRLLKCVDAPSPLRIDTDLGAGHPSFVPTGILVTSSQRRTLGIPSPIHEMISRWISLLPPPKVKITADR